MRNQIRRWTHRLAVAFGALAASIITPTVLIWADALMKRDAQATFVFALQMAEIAALMGAAGATFFGARRLLDGRGRAPDEGAAMGALSAACLFVAAIRVNDVDGWTVAAAVVLPLAGHLGGRAARRASRLRALASRIAVPAPGAQAGIDGGLPGAGNKVADRLLHHGWDASRRAH